MASMFSSLPKSLRIQMIATYIGMFMMIFGIIWLDYFLIFLLIAIVGIAVSYIYPFLEETNIIRGINEKKIAMFTCITEADKLPFTIQIEMLHWMPLAEFVEAIEEMDKENIEKIKANKEAEVAAGAQELIEFVESPVKKQVKEFLESMETVEEWKDKNVYYISCELNLDLPGHQFEEFILITHRKLNDMTTYPSFIDIKGYSIECRAIKASTRLVQIIDDMPIFEVSYLLDDEFEEQKYLELRRKETPLDLVKDKIIQALLSWRYRDIARLRKSEADIILYKENYELAFQRYQNLKLNTRYEVEPVHWIWYVGWVIALLVVLLALAGVF